MKKIFLLLTAVLFTCGFASAVNWVPVESPDNTTFFIDTDNIQYVKPNTCYYPMMYKKQNNEVRVSYIKSNYANNTLGILREDDYNTINYNPSYIYRSYMVFMKPVVQNSVVSNAHKYVSCLYNDSKAATALCNNTIYIDEHLLKDINTLESQAKMRNLIAENWKLPAKGRNKLASVYISVGEDGALNGYDILQSTGNNMADRAIISAIELTAPFVNIQNINMKLIFRSGFKKKIVE